MSPGEVADEVGVNEKTIRRWLEAGLIKGDRTVVGRWLVPPTVVLDLKRLATQAPLNARVLRARKEGRQPKS